MNVTQSANTPIHPTNAPQLNTDRQDRLNTMWDGMLLKALENLFAHMLAHASVVEDQAQVVELILKNNGKDCTALSRGVDLKVKFNAETPTSVWFVMFDKETNLPTSVTMNKAETRALVQMGDLLEKLQQAGQQADQQADQPAKYVLGMYKAMRVRLHEVLNAEADTLKIDALEIKRRCSNMHLEAIEGISDLEESELLKTSIVSTAIRECRSTDIEKFEKYQSTKK